jgi:hypothetical protein
VYIIAGEGDGDTQYRGFISCYGQLFQFPALIDSIGTSEMENQIRRKIMDITRKVSVEDELQSSLEE